MPACLECLAISEPPGLKETHSALVRYYGAEVLSIVSEDQFFQCLNCLAILKKTETGSESLWSIWGSS